MGLLSLFKKEKKLPEAGSNKAAMALLRSFDAANYFLSSEDQKIKSFVENLNGEIASSLPILRMKARDHEKNNDVVRRYFSLLRTHVVGPKGITLQCAFKDRSGKVDTGLTM